MNRNGLVRRLLNFCEWPGIELHYRDKKGCIIYISKNYSELYIDTPYDEETIYTVDLFKRDIPILLYSIISFLKITKVMLKENKRARRFVNKVMKKKFTYDGISFRECFDNRGEIDWIKVQCLTKLDKETIKFIVLDEYELGNYNPFKINKL